MQSDGCTLRQHLESAYRQTGRRPSLLEQIDIPVLMIHIWEWFIELSATRQYSEFGALPFTYQEIRSWSELTGTSVSPLDVKIIKELDNAYLVMSRKAKK